MDVFVIPLDRDRFELYCEGAVAGDEDDEPSGDGFWARARRRFGDMLRAAEDRERTGVAPEAAAGWMGRLYDRLIAWVAERIAEQRLLWKLRRQDIVTVVHPADMDFEATMRLVRTSLGSDRLRHLRWAIVHAGLFAVSGVIAIIPGPNLIAYLFAFRMVGHWLSYLGATHGLRKTLWNGRASSELSDVRAAVALPPAARDLRLREIGRALGLDGLPTFVDRLSGRRA